LEFFGLTVLIATGLMVPGWFWAKRYCHQSIWFFVLPLTGVAFWFTLIASRIGAQSLSNLIEIYGVAAAAIVGAYAKFLYFDRAEKRPGKGTVVAFAFVFIVALALRLFMPALPE